MVGVQELVPKRVGFSGGIPAADDVDPVARPSRLHRRDTPHHLKNKRITATVDKDKVASIIAKVSLSFFFFCFVLLMFYLFGAVLPLVGSADASCDCRNVGHCCLMSIACVVHV
jgi:hypothetical protein